MNQCGMRNPSRRAGELVKWLGIASLVLAAACSSPGAEQSGDPEAEEYRVPVRVHKLVPADLTEDVTVTGVLTSDGAVTVSARVGGTVSAVPVEIGSPVRAGSTLARIEERDYRIALAHAEAVEARARAADDQTAKDLRRIEALHESGVATDAELEGARLARDVAAADRLSAEAALDRAHLDLERCRVASPLDGTVAYVMVESGETLAPGAPVARIERLDRLEVEVGLAESEIGRIQLSTPVWIHLASLEEPELEGSIKTIGVAADPALGVYPVEVRLPAAAGPARPGMTARVRFEVGRHANTLAVPRDSVVERAGRRGVFVAEGARAEFRPVSTGVTTAGRTQVLEGLSSGDRVIVLGQANLQDGQAVSATLQEP